MNNELTICKLNESYGYLLTEDAYIVKEVYDFLSFWVPGYRFVPSYINGFWNGKINLMELSTRKFPIGLSKDVYEFCRSKGYSCNVENAILDSFQSSESTKDLEEFYSSKKFFSKKNQIKPREDQLEATIRAIQTKRSINICPTSFGKSLAITLECLWYISRGLRCLIVVPTKDLVDQFYNDIKDYATNETGDLEPWYPKSQMIYSGKTKEIDEDTNIVISTWQSLAKTEEGFMNRFDVIILDECHKGSANVISKLMLSADCVEYRTGWTGTLSNETIGELQVKGLFGPIKQIITTKELMDKGIVAQLSICIVRLKYPQEIARELINLDYTNQTKYIEKNTKRTKTLIDIASTQPKTGLMLYKHIPHGEELYKYAMKKFPDRNVYLIHGGYFMMNEKKYKTFDDIKQIIEEDTSGIVIANYQVVGTGISIKNLHWMMFAAPVKSFITTVQGIGRILRISKVKNKALLLDIVDDFSYKKRTAVTENYALRHFAERFKIYNESKFEYILHTMNVDPREAPEQGNDLTKF